MLTGVYAAKKKDGIEYFRASITYNGKHISLGSYDTEEDAHKAYVTANNILTSTSLNKNFVRSYNADSHIMPFYKWVSLINLRDNGIYFKVPIYIRHNYFLYFYDEETQFKFDVDDLFFYSTHMIMKRGKHLFVADYGMQINILSRYGIRNHAVEGRDYRFVNGDNTDFRYGNIEIINRYYGVTKHALASHTLYETKININGTFVVGRYSTEIDAAIAYNKAAETLKNLGIDKKYPVNYIDGIDDIEYASRYHKVRISDKIRNYKS